MRKVILRIDLFVFRSRIPIFNPFSWSKHPSKDKSSEINVDYVMLSAVRRIEPLLGIVVWHKHNNRIWVLTAAILHRIPKWYATKAEKRLKIWRAARITFMNSLLIVSKGWVRGLVRRDAKLTSKVLRQRAPLSYLCK